MKTTFDPTATAKRIVPLYSLLSDEQRQLLIDNISVRSYNRNDLLFESGQTPTHLFVLLLGKVTQEYVKDLERPIIIRLVEPGSMFGYFEALNGNSYILSARADDNTRVALIPIQLILRFIDENNLVTRLFLKKQSELIDISINRTVYLLQKHLRGRLAQCLVRLKEKYGTSNDGQTLSIYISRKDLANVAFMTPSNCIRTLSEFSKEGFIALVGRHISIVDEAALREVARKG